MIQFGKNGTAHSTNFLTKQEAEEALEESIDYDKEYNMLKGRKNHFGKSILNGYSSVAQTLVEEYEKLDGDYILEITKLLSTFTDKETSDSNFHVCRVALDNKIKPDEIYLMETMFENDLESLSKDGIKIFEIDGCLDIRNKGVEKHLSHEDREKMEEHLIGSDSGSFDDFLDGGVDVSGQTITANNTPTTANGITVGSRQGVKEGVSLQVDSIEFELEDGKEIEMEGVMTSGNH